MPVPGPGDTISLKAIELTHVSNPQIADGRMTVDLIVPIFGTRDRIASITMKAWEVKPNEYVPGLVSLTFTFDTQPDLTLWVTPDRIEWAQPL